MPPARSFSSRTATSSACRDDADPSKPTTAYTGRSADPLPVPAVCCELVVSVGMICSCTWQPGAAHIELISTTLNVRVVVCNPRDRLKLDHDNAPQDPDPHFTTLAR